MDHRRLQLWCVVLLGALWAGAGPAQAQGVVSHPREDQWQRLRAVALVPLEQVPAELRESVRQVLEKPTLHAQGPSEAFPCRPDLYYWFLDHPDRAMQAWQRLGAVCLPITAQGAGHFVWTDNQGSEVRWETIYRGDNVRVWYAQGQVKPGPLLPTVPARAVVVLRHAVIRDREDGPVVHHQADVFVYTDSRTAILVTRLMGPSVPRLAEQGVGQMQMFFSALSWYLQRYPERAQTLLGSLTAAPTGDPLPAVGQANRGAGG